MTNSHFHYSCVSREITCMPEEPAAYGFLQDRPVPSSEEACPAASYAAGRLFRRALLPVSALLLSSVLFLGASRCSAPPPREPRDRRTVPPA